MPTPDKTMDDVSKLVAEVRADVSVILRDALESVAKERDEKQALYETTYRQLKIEESMCDEAEAKIAALATERDALREALEFYAERGHIQNEGTGDEIVENGLIARAALAAQRGEE